MLYNIRLHLHYDYERSAAGGRHQIRVMPQTMPGVQRVIASSLSFDPVSTERSEFTDFFSNTVTSIVYRNPHETLDVTMTARVNVTRPPEHARCFARSRRPAKGDRSVWSIAADAPHHFLTTQRPCNDRSGDHGLCRARALSGTRTVMEAVKHLNNRIHADFTYDGRRRPTCARMRARRSS